MTKSLYRYSSMLILYISALEMIFPQVLKVGSGSAVEKGSRKLEQYLEKADSFNENQRWQEIASEGLSVALWEWEQFSIPQNSTENSNASAVNESSTENLIESSTENSAANFSNETENSAENFSREQVLQYFNLKIEKRYEQYLNNKIKEEKYSDFYNGIKKELENISLKLQEKNKGAELTSEEAELQWEKAASEFLENYIASWNIEKDSPWITNAQELAVSIGNNLLLNELYDKESLKVLSDSDSASFIAKELADNVEEKTETLVDTLFDNLNTELSVNEKETEKFTEENWLSKFENEMDKALLSWDEAEKEFLQKKVSWEENAKENYASGIEKWESAYDEFLQKKENWQKEISSRVEEAMLQLDKTAQNYSEELSEKLLEYGNFLNEKNSSYIENYNEQKETYAELRNLLTGYKENCESWASVWKNKFNGLYDFWKCRNYMQELSELSELINCTEIDIEKIDSSYASKISEQFNKLNTQAEDYIEMFSEISPDCFKDKNELMAAEKDITEFFNGIIFNKNTEEILRNEVTSCSEKILEECNTPIDLEVNQAEFHLKEIKEEYEIALAVNNYALSISNTTENAFDSEQNKKNAENAYNAAKAEYENNCTKTKKEWTEKTEAIKNEIKNNSQDLLFVSSKLRELAELNSEHSKAVEKLNEENLSLEDLRIKMRCANAIYDFGNSIYLDKNDALKKLNSAKEALAAAEENLALVKSQKSGNNSAVSQSALASLNELKKSEEKYLAVSVVLEEVYRKIEECKKNISDAETAVEEKKNEIVYEIQNPEISGKLELVRITKNSDGNFEVSLDLNGASGSSIDKESFSEFFNGAASSEENLNDNSSCAAKEDLVLWTDKMVSDWSYFEDVVLSALYLTSINGYLNNVDDKNINPLDRDNVKYVLSGVDPDDTLGSIGLYRTYRQETLEEAYERTKAHSGWESDVARCLLYKDTESIAGSNIDRIETYAMNFTAYKKLYEEYSDKRDDHSFCPGIFGSTFMDNDGKLADACMKKMKDLQEQVTNNLDDVHSKLLNAVNQYETALNTVNINNSKLNEVLYNEENVSEGGFTSSDFEEIIKSLVKDNDKIASSDVAQVLELCSKNEAYKDIVAVLEDIKNQVKTEKEANYSKVLTLTENENQLSTLTVEMYKNLSSSAAAKMNLNNSMEDFYSNIVDSINGVVIYASNLYSEKQYSNYSNELSETFDALQRNLVQKYNEVCNIEKYSEEKWTSAEENLNYEYNLWVQNFQKEYEEKNENWNKTYTEFLTNRQDYISKNYIEQVAAALNVDISKNETEEICDSFSFNSDDINSSEKIQSVIDSLSSLTDSFSVTEKNKVSSDEFFYTDIMRQEILAEQKEVAAKQSAYEAYNILDSKKTEGLDKVKELNLAQKEWETETVRNYGYTVTENEIKRKGVDGCTLFSVLYQTQTVHMYEDYVPEAFEYSVNLAAATCLDEETIKKLMETAFKDYEAWETKIFGSENEEGEFKKYLGDSPELKANVNVNEDNKENSFDFKVKGEITIILMDIQWNNLEENAAYAEFNKPVWDQKIMDASWAPTLRTTSTIAAAVAASVVSCGTLAAGASVYTAAALSSAVTMANEVNFAVLDYAGGYKSPYEIAKSLASSAVSSAVGIATAGIGDKISNIESSAKKIGASVLYAGGKTTFNSVSNAFITNGFNVSDSIDALKSKSVIAKTISSMISSGVTSGLDELNVGSNLSNVRGFSSNEISKIKSFDSLAGDGASSLFEYGYTGETTLNLASVKGVGLLELNIGEDGVSSQIGMNGSSINAGRILNAAGGLGYIYENYKINNYSDGNGTLASALRMQYAFGNDDAKVQLKKILKNEILLEYEDENYVAKSVTKDGIKKISLGTKSNQEDYLELGMLLQHEAERNGITDSPENQLAETILSVLSHTAIIESMKYDPIYKDMISDYEENNESLKYDLIAVNNYKENNSSEDLACYVLGNYDMSEDYWKMTWGGQILYDGEGYLTDYNGRFVNSDGTHTYIKTDKTIGAKDVKLGLLNIINNSCNLGETSFTKEQKDVAVDLMKKAGLIEVISSNENDDPWGSKYNNVGKKIDMSLFMKASGSGVNNDIFEKYFNHEADLVLAQRYDVDLGFTIKKSTQIPECLIDKFNDLVIKHSYKTQNGKALYDKYKFDVKNSDGTTSSYFKLTKDNPFLDDLLGQHDFKPEKVGYENDAEKGIYNVINKSGCNFMAAIAIPQLLTGQIFSVDDVKDIIKTATTETGNFPDPDKEGNIVTDSYLRKSDAYVFDRNYITDLAVKKINNSTFYAASVVKNISSKYVAGNRIGYLKLNEDTGKYYVCHFALADVWGNTIYNPGYGTTNVYNLYRIYVGER